MRTKLWNLDASQLQKYIAITVACLSIISIAIATIMESMIIMIAPFAFIVILICIYRFSWIYLLFFLTIPFSIEIYLSNGLGTDLPTEPFMLVLTGIGLIFGLYHLKDIKAAWLLNPITLLLFAHVFWILFTTISSQNQVVSFKFLLAKLWYIVPCYCLAMYMLHDPRWYSQWVRYFTCILGLAITYVMIRHATLGFSFDGINSAGSPFFRNHVNYAALMVVFLPHLWALWSKSRRESKNGLFILSSLGIVYILVATYFTYTRAAHVCIFIALAAYYIIRKGWVRPTVFASIIVLVVGVSFLLQNNRYLRLAPNYERTVSHHSYDNLLEATYKLEDLSTMERVYRWVAGIEMIKQKPLVGFGPGNFYNFYKKYTVSSFKTYVSHNPDKSGIHNYYLMSLVEQGIFGFLIFVLLNIYALFIGQRIYLQIRNPDYKNMLMAAMLSTIVINAMLLINDLIEADKVGTLFFFNLAIITFVYVTQGKSS